MKRRVPSRQRIKQMLDDMLDKGTISMTDYEFGIKGLPLVHKMVEGQNREGNKNAKDN